MDRGVCRSAHCECHSSSFQMPLVPRCGVAFRRAAVRVRRHRLLHLRILREVGLEEVAGLEKRARAQIAGTPAPVMARARMAKEIILAKVAEIHRAARAKAAATTTMTRADPIRAGQMIRAEAMAPERMA